MLSLHFPDRPLRSGMDEAGVSVRKSSIPTQSLVKDYDIAPEFSNRIPISKQKSGQI